MQNSPGFWTNVSRVIPIRHLHKRDGTTEKRWNYVNKIDLSSRQKFIETECFHSSKNTFPCPDYIIEEIRVGVGCHFV